MSQVLLRDYLEEMRTHLREGKYGDVFALGQHVLRYYPKQLETYRMLAQASLETDDLTAAADLFQRVRSADPENIFALVGLSIVHELRKELEEAIWHLERAFEIQPANQELRTELLRLYAAFEGAPRTRLKLTSGGLARLYARQGLYAQAIQEFRAVLRRDPTRADAQVALAEVLYRVGRKQEAADLAQALLDQLPFCLKANLLLGALWSENGVPEAETLLRRARSLDPDNTVARGLVPDHWDDAPPPRLPAMSEEAASTAQSASGSLPKFEESTERELFLLQSLSAIAEPPAESMAAPTSEPATEAPSTVEPPTAGQAGVVAQAESPVAPSSAEQVPASGAEAAEEKGSPLPPVIEPLVPLKTIGEPTPLRRQQPSLPKIGPTIPGAMDKLPAWLRHVAPPITAQQVPIAPPQAPPQIEAPAPGRQDWLTRARQAARRGTLEDAHAHIAPTSPVEEISAPLTDTGAELPRPIEDKETIPEWLRSGPTTAPPAETTEEVEMPLPDWLAHTEPEGQAQVPSGPPSTNQLAVPKQSEDALPFAPPGSEGGAEAEPPVIEANAPVSSQPAPSEPEILPEPASPDLALPDWLQSQSAGEPQPLAPSSEMQVPTWLASPTPEAETAPKVETPLGPSGSEGDDTIPDWLREISGEVEVAPVASDTIQSKPLGSASAEAVASNVTKAEPSAEISAKPSTEISPPPAVSQPVAVEPVTSIAEPATEAQAKGKLDFEPETLLAEARALRASGNIARAIDLYAKILQKGPRFSAAVIADLEKFVQEPDAPLPIHRLLGDAYAQVGRFPEALEQYRTVLGK